MPKFAYAAIDTTGAPVEGAEVTVEAFHSARASSVGQGRRRLRRSAARVDVADRGGDVRVGLPQGPAVGGDGLFHV